MRENHTKTMNNILYTCQHSLSVVQTPKLRRIAEPVLTNKQGAGKAGGETAHRIALSLFWKDMSFLIGCAPQVMADLLQTTKNG